ncbi:hypothetical protein K493DRAFT_312881 [Basidiobolus meristosporus CBS 931.73]|uniref:Zn(2)-C6 fungal-type domain-containing protein n=1 Tax=Basidiobolus meristosporus CBS 931.73 TaxID=1314790 RepID=A0A1Y1YQF2_9FUNG|nr:hypothetical protein K493DRAFT_312881 [Basidiobolus meristosporus CBS 931.73]|eukprot:ORY00262.1 hypothetical protein K493DRAFT_312881 [Basidiobolus meristosporus CBS 931.73]
MEFHTQIFSIFPANPDQLLDETSRPKRKQVKNACINCQKACKKCDEGRPCQRCIKYGLGDTCRNSVRKERRKGERRGPYIKKESKSRYTTPHNEPHFSVISPISNATKPQAIPKNIELMHTQQSDMVSSRSASPASSSGFVSDLLQTPPPSPAYHKNLANTVLTEGSPNEPVKGSPYYPPVSMHLPSAPLFNATSTRDVSSHGVWMNSNLQLPPLTNHTQLPSFREILSSINC